MTVKELIRLLSLYNDDTHVFVQNALEDYAEDIARVERFNDSCNKILLVTCSIEEFDERLRD